MYTVCHILSFSKQSPATVPAFLQCMDSIVANCCSGFSASHLPCRHKLFPYIVIIRQVFVTFVASLFFYNLRYVLNVCVWHCVHRHQQHAVAGRQTLDSAVMLWIVTMTITYETECDNMRERLSYCCNKLLSWRLKYLSFLNNYKDVVLIL